MSVDASSSSGAGLGGGVIQPRPHTHLGGDRVSSRRRGRRFLGSHVVYLSPVCRRVVSLHVQCK